MVLPYRAEYAKSGRARCRGCRETIDKGLLRLAIMTQSQYFDGYQPDWHHYECFFRLVTVDTTDDIAHFESLRIEDQDRIKSRIEGGIELPIFTKGLKRECKVEECPPSLIIEYSKTSGSKCRGCGIIILSDEIGVKTGTNDWYELSCFSRDRSKLGFVQCADRLTGFDKLKKYDQDYVKTLLPSIAHEIPSSSKKLKVEPIENGNSPDAEYRKQNKIIYDYRDKLTKLKKHELTDLLIYNGQRIPKGTDRILDRLSDCMAFGALNHCPECQRGQLVFSKSGYNCTGYVSEWSKCTYTTKEPSRSQFVIPQHFKEIYLFLNDYQYVPKNRVIKDVIPSPVKGSSDETDGSYPALHGMSFVLGGRKFNRGKEALKQYIVSLGGEVVSKVSKKVLAVIVANKTGNNKLVVMAEAEAEGVQVVPEMFVDLAKSSAGKIPELIENMKIRDWGTDPIMRLPSYYRTEMDPKSGKSISRIPSSGSRSVVRSVFRSQPSKIRLQLKGGSAVDPDSELDNQTHVYQEDNEKWTAVLGLTDVINNRNSYYKLQLLEGDHSSRYWLFRSWGRIGTTIGGKKTEEKLTLEDAKSTFEELYAEKSGNHWEDRHNFVKVPGRMYPIDIDYGEKSGVNLNIAEADSTLPIEVQNLVRLIFDVNQMEKLMLDFELDTEKMPLGKLSRNQINQAYTVLTDLQRLLDGKASEIQLIESTNRFYTLIPHNFGTNEVTILRNKESIKQKIGILDSLMEMEIAYNLMTSSGSDNTIDGYYKQLKTEISVLDKNSEEFKIIQLYVENTHGSTHTSYYLLIEDVFVIKREGEETRFEPFKTLHNRKLLWHGSRTTNFAGILSQGLRIAPPEAPVSGYMFGKGLYFADMVSKSANYCFSTTHDPTGLLLLCDVALGNMNLAVQARTFVKPPDGFHSVMGVGMTHPNPAEIATIGESLVPLGKGVGRTQAEMNNQRTALLYNEYIVYDVAQVNIKYLLKVKFRYKIM